MQEPGQAQGVLAGGGEMGRLMREYDWAMTPLGPVDGWQQSLKVALRILLGSRYPMFVWWGRQMIMFHNDAYAPILGKRHPAALGKSAPTVWEEIWPDITPLIDPVWEGQACWQEERLLVMERNGYTEEAYFTFSYSPIPDDNGAVGGIFCACSEDTQRVMNQRRMRALRELAEKTSEARTVHETCRMVAAVLGDSRHDLPFTLLYLLDDDGKTAHLHGSTGLPPDSFASSVTLARPEECRWPLAEVSKAGQARVVTGLDGIGPLVDPVWPEPPTAAIVLPIRNSGQDRPAGILVAGISTRRAFDDDYRGFMDMLAGHVASAIASARAYEDEKRRAEALAELDRAKTTFFSNVSHEFRTPLTLMLGPVEDVLASDVVLPTRERESLTVAHRNALRLQKLVNTLLDFSRIEAGRVQASYEATDLGHYTAELASNFRSACERAGLELVVDCPSLPEPVFVDRDMWEKIVLNLISNAFKYTLEGSIEISLREAKGEAVLSVRDTGTGIPAEQIPLLFERFHRVENARGRTQEGTGIGLALVKELVRLHGGEVRVESEPGRGSTFRVSIPLGKAHIPPDRIDAAPRLASTALGAAPYVEEAMRWLPSSGVEQKAVPNRSAALDRTAAKPERMDAGHSKQSRPHVLLADDNADMRDYIERLLAGEYDVTAVPDGLQALKAARELLPDLIVTDIMMPGLDGFGLLKELRSNAATAGIPVLLLSARAGEEARVEGLRHGADDYLTKPFSSRELLARVSAQLELLRVRREARQSLRESEVRFRELVDQAPFSVQLLSPDGHTVRVNFAWEELWGITLAQIADYNILKDPQLEAKGIAPYLRRAFAGEAVQIPPILYDPNETIPNRTRHADPVRWVSAVAYPIKDRDGRVQEVVLVHRDETARIRAEAELQQSEAQSRTILESISEGFFALDRSWNFTYVNQQGERLLGCRREDLLGKNIWEMYQPAVGSDFERYYRQAMSENVSVDFEAYYEPHERWYDVHAYPFHHGLGIYFRDANDRRRAANALRESEAKYRALAEAMPFVVWQNGPDGGSEYANEYFTRFTGLTAESLSSQGWAQCVHPDDLPVLLERRDHSLQSGEPLDVEHRLRRFDGEYRWFHTFGSLIRDTEGKPSRWIGASLDVHDERRAKEALRESQATLRSFYDTSPMMMGVVDVLGEDIFHLTDNAATGRFFGSDPALIAGRWASELGISAEVLREWVRAYSESERTGLAVRLEYPHPLGDGVRWISATVFCIARLEEGRFRCSYVAEDVTERKQAEQALRDAENRWRSLAEAVPNLVWTDTPDGRCDYLSTQWGKYTGIPEQELLGLNWLEVVIHPDDRERTRECWNAAVRDLGIYDLEYRIRRHDGRYRWFKTRGVPIRDEQGRIVKWFGTCTDIEDQKQLLEQLRTSERRLRELADVMPQMVYTARPDGSVDYLNRRWYEYTGLPEGEISPESWLGALHPDDREPCIAERARTMPFGLPFEMELRLREGRTGEYRWHLARSVSIRNEAGEVVRWYGTSTDIHDRKKSGDAAEFLSSASAVLAAVGDYEATLQKVAALAVPHFADWSAVDMVEPDGSLRSLAVVHRDPGKVQLAKELMNRYPRDPEAKAGISYVLRSRKPEIMPLLTDEMLVQGARDPEHLELLRDLGLRSYICVPLTIADKAIGVLTFATAESSRTYAHADLALAQDLAHRAAVAIENARLYAELRHADRMKDEFLAMLAHELRNPLAPVRNALHIMKQPAASRTMLQKVQDMAERQVQHMARLLDDLLDVSRISRGKIELRKETIDLSTVVNRSVEAVRTLFEQRQHELALSLPPVPLSLSADVTRMEQVLSNLLNNAAKYTDPGGRIQVIARREGNDVVVSVRDTGIGIAPDMLPRVFDLFVQAERRLDRSRGGVGIGLTLVRKLVELHGGRIEARSGGLGQGSEFIVTLPVLAGSAEPARGEKPSESTSGLPRFRVMVVDDNRDAAESLAMLLRLAGQEVKTAYDGPTTLELVPEFQPHLVFLDIGMPGMDGYQVASKLRQQPSSRNLPLVAVTGWGQADDKRRSRDAGFDHHLVKPVEPGALEQLLASLERFER
jgi:PAS domain S-box-containing protein